MGTAHNRRSGKVKPVYQITPPANHKAVFESMDYAVVPPALIEQAAASEIINAVFSTLEPNNMSAQEALDDI
jgi:hypothetical protein